MTEPISNTKEYNQSLSDEEILEITKRLKGGTWYDEWVPYHVKEPFDPNCKSPRMIRMSWGWYCPSCGTELGWNGQRIMPSNT